MAVRHRSVSHKDTDGKWVNNERLEFLGDAVLNAIVSDMLYHRYANEKEGFLTNARSNIVKRDSLNNICRQIGLDKLVVLDKKLCPQKSNNIYGNALEAFIGAAYLDVGYVKCAEFVKKQLLGGYKWLEILAEDNANYKSELFEWCQQRYLTLDYVLIEDTVDSSNRHMFISKVLIEDIPICTGAGASKKESHQQASFRALEMIKNEKDFIDKLIINQKKKT